MSTETELRSALRATANVPSTLDADVIIRKARNRRLPKQIGFGSVATMAVGGIGFAGFTAIPFPQSALMSASDSAGSAESNSQPQVPASGYGLERAAADRVNPCGAALAQVAPNAAGLVLTTHFPAAAAANGQPVSGTVTLTNTGTARVTGTTAASPAITVSRNGVTVWHSNGPMIALAMLIDLDPGESMDYPASLTPVECSVDKDFAEGFPENLPALGAGDYEVSALIDLLPDNTIDGGGNQLVAGPSQALSLR